MRPLLLSTACFLLLPALAQAECTRVCPVYNMGEIEPGTWYYYALHHLGTCADSEPIGWEGDNNAEASCDPPASCSGCYTLGGDGLDSCAEDKASTPKVENTAKESETTTKSASGIWPIPLPLPLGLDYDPNSDGVTRPEGSSTTLIGRTYVKLLDQTESFRYVRVFLFQHTQPIGGGEKRTAIIAIGFESLNPGGDVPQLIGPVHRVRAYKRNGTSRLIPNFLKMDFGMTTLHVRVQNHHDWNVGPER